MPKLKNKHKNHPILWEKICFRYHGVSLYPYPQCYVNTRSFWGQTSRRQLSKKGKKGGWSNQGTGRGHGPGSGGKKKDTYNTPKPSPKTDNIWGSVSGGGGGGGGVASGHLWPICPSKSDLEKCYRIEFTRRPPITMEPWWTPLARNTARRADLEKVHAGEEGNRRDPPLNGHPRVLFPNIPCSKRFGWLAPNSKSQSVKSPCVDVTFPYGNPADCDGLHRGGSPTSEECLRTHE